MSAEPVTLMTGIGSLNVPASVIASGNHEPKRTCQIRTAMAKGKYDPIQEKLRAIIRERLQERKGDVVLY